MTRFPDINPTNDPAKEAQCEKTTAFMAETFKAFHARQASVQDLHTSRMPADYLDRRRALKEKRTDIE